MEPAGACNNKLIFQMPFLKSPPSVTIPLYPMRNTEPHSPNMNIFLTCFSSKQRERPTYVRLSIPPVASNTLVQSVYDHTRCGNEFRATFNPSAGTVTDTHKKLPHHKSTYLSHTGCVYRNNAPRSLHLSLVKQKLAVLKFLVYFPSVVPESSYPPRGTLLIINSQQL